MIYLEITINFSEKEEASYDMAEWVMIDLLVRTFLTSDKKQPKAFDARCNLTGFCKGNEQV